MPRSPRNAPGGYIYHVLNRANARMTMFEKDEDYQVFEGILADSLKLVPGMRLLTYCLLPDHWHLVLWPRRDGELSDFTRRVAHTHTRRWHAQRRELGGGHLYQSRFKSFPVHKDEHLVAVCRFVEGNPVRSKLVDAAKDWRWGSLWRHTQGSEAEQSILSDWPVAAPRNYLSSVDRPFKPAELARLLLCLQRGQPYGPDAWIQKTAVKLGLESSLRPRGRPRKTIKE